MSVKNHDEFRSVYEKFKLPSGLVDACCLESRLEDSVIYNVDVSGSNEQYTYKMVHVNCDQDKLVQYYETLSNEIRSDKHHQAFFRILCEQLSAIEEIKLKEMEIELLQKEASVLVSTDTSMRW